jgi:hypothetical protein
MMTKTRTTKTTIECPIISMDASDLEAAVQEFISDENRFYIEPTMRRTIECPVIAAVAA